MTTSTAAPLPPRHLLEALVDRTAGSGREPAPCARRVPVSHYTDASRFDCERERLFLGLPQVVAASSQLSKPGDTLVYDWLGLPLLTTRDHDGRVGTFMNVCRHRGMRLVEDEGCHELRSLICPYHTWTYGLDGRLRNIPRAESFADIDAADNGLVALPTQERHGLVWVLPTPGATLDVDGHLAGLGADLDAFGLDTAHYFTGSVKRIACNWKLIHDAFLDGYHVVRLHKNSVGPFFPDALAESDAVGRHIRSAVARNEIFDAGGLPPEQLDLRRHATFSYTLFPGSIIIMHPDYTSVISLFPQGPGETVFVHSMLLFEAPADDGARAHFERSFELIDRGVFEAEDIHVSEQAQRGFASGANDSLLFGALESTAADFHANVEAALK